MISQKATSTPTTSVLIVLTMFLLSQSLLVGSVYSSSSASIQESSSPSSCISYNPEDNMITITCQSANLTVH
jgi:hypothetical protein